LKFLADGKFLLFYVHFDCIYAHKNDKLQKNQVSTTSWVFEYSIMYCKNSKTQKTEEKVKTKDIFQFHSCLNNFSICKLADSCLKKITFSTRVVFYLEVVDYTCSSNWIGDVFAVILRKNMVPGIWEVRDCCHFPKVLEGNIEKGKLKRKLWFH
jgi:hypothetical protein